MNDEGDRKPPRLISLRTVAVMAVLLVVLLLVAGHGHADVARRHAPAPQTPGRVLVDGKGVRWWAARARVNGAAARWQTKRADHLARHAAALERELHRRVVDPLEDVYEHSAALAATVYGVDAATLIRKGRCESQRWTRFLNSASGAAGPWQFLPSTWATTPFAAWSPYDPFAAALAAAWMHSPRVGRGDEWECR